MNLKPETIEEWQEHLAKLRGMVEYHVLSASNYVLDCQAIEKIIEDKKNES